MMSDFRKDCFCVRYFMGLVVGEDWVGARKGGWRCSVEKCPNADDGTLMATKGKLPIPKTPMYSLFLESHTPTRLFHHHLPLPCITPPRQTCKHPPAAHRQRYMVQLQSGFLSIRSSQPARLKRQRLGFPQWTP